MCLIWENYVRFIKALYLFNSYYSCGHFINPEKIFQVFIWLSKMQSLILNKPMPFKGTWEATFGSILRNNKVNMPTGTNWLNSPVNIDFKMYNIWELNITHPFFRFVFLQPGQHCPKMWIENIEVEMREKKYMYFRLSCLDFSTRTHLIISFVKKINMDVKGSFKWSFREVNDCRWYWWGCPYNRAPTLSCEIKESIQHQPIKHLLPPSQVLQGANLFYTPS